MRLAGGELYDDCDPQLRNRINQEDLANLPLLGEDDTEKEVFNRAGQRVMRRIPKDVRHAGVLFDLGQIAQQFEGVGDNRLDAEEDVPVSCTLYPQAGLRTVGQWQATGVTDSFCRVVSGVNASIHNSQRRHRWDDANRGNEEESEDSESDEEDLPAMYGAVQAIFSQGYNIVVHRSRNQGKAHHDAQQGRLTAAILGTYALSDKHREKARKQRDHLALGLPHERYDRKIADPMDANQPPCARLENVYVLRYDRLPEAMRNGR